MFSTIRFGWTGSLAIVCAAALAAGATQEAPRSLQYGPLTLNGFELREAKFDPPFFTTAPDGTRVQHAAGWQIAVRGPDFPIRALDPELWVDGTRLVHYERHDAAGEQELAFCVVDPKLLRAERSLELIYGRDERTRTKIAEKLDPKKLVQLPQDQRTALGIPELEGLRLATADAGGRISGRAKLSEGAVRLAARLGGEKLAPLGGAVALGKDGEFSVEAGPLPAGTTQVIALLLTGDGKQDLAKLDLTALPKEVEVLDRKAVAGR